MKNIFKSLMKGKSGSQEGMTIPPQKPSKLPSLKSPVKQKDPKGNPNRFDKINAETERSNRESK